uniref:Putative group i salivary lipocalin n=1 Tax=Hyalomma excavatum TaxID=257692 RepID=A0A131XL57_9ACAR
MHSVIIASFIGLAAGAFDYSGSATLQDVKDFFSTSNDILLLARSYTHRINGYEPMCIYNEKWSITSKKSFIFITVLQHYRYGDERSQSAFGYPVYYTISRNAGMDDAPLMRATNRSDEKADHQQDSTKCELHIWKENYGLPIENCKREFVYRCPRHPYYFPSESLLCPFDIKYKLARGSFQFP